MNLILNAMENSMVELTAEHPIEGMIKIQRGIFQEDSLSPLLLFLIAMMPLSHVLRKYIRGYKFFKSHGKINHFKDMYNTKEFVKNEKELETLIETIRIYSQNIGMEFGMEKCAMLIMKNEKGESEEGIELQNQEYISMERKKTTSTWE